MEIKNYFWILIVAVIVASAGCASTSHRHGQSEENADLVGSTDLDAEYTLLSVDGIPIPGKVNHDGIEIELFSGRFKFKPDGRCFTETVFSPPGAQRMTRMVKATYLRNGSSLVMRWEGAGTTTGSIDGDMFTMDNHGMIFTYQKRAEQ